MLWKKASKSVTLALVSAGIALPILGQTVYEAEAKANSISGSTKIAGVLPVRER